jgi:hypothetical protein
MKADQSSFLHMSLASHVKVTEQFSCNSMTKLQITLTQPSSNRKSASRSYGTTSGKEESLARPSIQTPPDRMRFSGTHHHHHHYEKEEEFSVPILSILIGDFCPLSDRIGPVASFRLSTGGACCLDDFFFFFLQVRTATIGR